MAGRYSPQQVGLWLNSLPGYGQTKFKGQQSSSFEALSKADLYPNWVSWSESLSWFCRWAKPLVGIITWALQVYTWSAKIHVQVAVRPFPLLYHNQIPSGWAQQMPMQSPWGSHKWPTVQRELVAPILTPGVFFTTGGTSGSEETSVWCCACLGEGRCRQHVAASLIQCVLVSVKQEVPSTSPLCANVLSVVPCSSTVVSLFCEGEQSQELPMLSSRWHHSPPVMLLKLSVDWVRLMH